MAKGKFRTETIVCVSCRWETTYRIHLRTPEEQRFAGAFRFATGGHTDEYPCPRCKSVANLKMELTLLAMNTLSEIEPEPDGVLDTGEENLTGEAEP